MTSLECVDIWLTSLINHDMQTAENNQCLLWDIFAILGRFVEEVEGGGGLETPKCSVRAFGAHSWPTIRCGRKLPKNKSFMSLYDWCYCHF